MRRRRSDLRWQGDYRRRTSPGTARSSTRRMSGASPSSIRRSARAARLLRRFRRQTRRRLHQVARRHHRRAPARPYFHQRQPAARKGPEQLLGLQFDRLFRPRSALCLRRRQSLREFKEMVARFHEAGLEVILDVVYNHTAEGNERGPTLSFKGIDNARISADARPTALLHQRHRHRKHAQPQPSAGHPDGHRQPAILGDELHVDGFRFDLGTILCAGARRIRQTESGFLKAVRPGSVLARSN